MILCHRCRSCIADELSISVLLTLSSNTAESPLIPRAQRFHIHSWLEYLSANQRLASSSHAAGIIPMVSILLSCGLAQLRAAFTTGIKCSLNSSTSAVPLQIVIEAL